ncbi:hypothetical protein DFJ74DRAFT_658672 [Hyaloraphidium curvatum]|nr:hypothetical protein DFJ74DRAFT_658672 [Hyaloraphidium curvatum]
MGEIKAEPKMGHDKPAADDPRIIRPVFQTPEEYVARDGQVEVPADAMTLEEFRRLHGPNRPAAAADARPGAGTVEDPASNLNVTYPPPAAAVSGNRLQSRYVTTIPSNAPLFFNPFPTSFGNYYYVDVSQMEQWNRFVDVFRITVPSGTYSFGNGLSDMAGWVSTPDAQRIYGFTWGPNDLANCVVRAAGGRIIEADILLNPAFGWTLDMEWIYNGGQGVHSLRQTLLHELGHALGLAHNFYGAATMNYYEDPYRGWPYLFADDAEGARALHPSRAISRDDQGAYLFRPDGYQHFADAEFPTTVLAGTDFTLSRFLVENLGTRELTARLDVYISKTRTFVGGEFHEVARIEWPNRLGRFSHFDPDLVSLTLRMPWYANGGEYFLVIASADNGARAPISGVAFPGPEDSNNYSWSRGKITVYARLLELNPADASFPYSAQSGFQVLMRVRLGGFGYGDTVVALTTDNPGLVTIPQLVSVPSGQLAHDFFIRFGYARERTIVAIHATNRGVVYTSYVAVLPAAGTRISVSAPVARRGNMVTLLATVRFDNGTAVAGQQVIFQIAGVAAGNAATDAAGTARLAWRVPIVQSMRHAVLASFGGGDGAAPSNAEWALRVFAETRLAGRNTAGRRTRTVTLSATLRAFTAAGPPVAGQAVVFRIAGAVVGRATTNAAGVASVGYRIPARARLGINNVAISAAATQLYGASSATARLTVSA